MLVNAGDVKHLPGRPKTDRLDAVWLCKVAKRQMLQPSFVPPPPIRILRDLTRYRVDLGTLPYLGGKRMQWLIQSSLQLEIRPTLNHFADIMWAPTTLAELER